MNHNEMTTAVIGAALKTAPPVVVATSAAAGAIDMTFWTAIVTIGYVLAQTGYLLWKWHREWTKRDKE